MADDIEQVGVLAAMTPQLANDSGGNHKQPSALRVHAPDFILSLLGDSLNLWLWHGYSNLGRTEHLQLA